MLYKDYIIQKKAEIMKNEQSQGFQGFTDISNIERKRLLEYKSFSSEYIKSRKIDKRPAIEVIDSLIESYINDNYEKPVKTFFLESYLEDCNSSDFFTYIDHTGRQHHYLNDYPEIISMEQLELKYLKKFTHFLLFARDEILEGLATQQKIYEDWYPQWIRELEVGAKKGISDFAVGAERIIYSLLNGKSVGLPNSSPVGSDLFFETSEAFVHIDLKTVEISNMDDYRGKITVGNNQNSYNFNPTYNKKGEMLKKGYINANLPFFYSVESAHGLFQYKPSLTYFITILYEKEEMEILNISIFSMPNGSLFPIYGNEIIGAGKLDFKDNHSNKGEYYKTIRYYWKNALKFYTQDEYRYNSVYFNGDLLSVLSERNEQLFTDNIVQELKRLLIPKSMIF